MRGRTGSDYDLGGVDTPVAVLRRPADYIRSFAQGLASTVGVFENSPVLALARKGGVWEAASHRGGVQAPRVILAVNGHIENLGHFSDRLIHLLTYASMFLAFSPNPPGRAATGTAQ